MNEESLARILAHYDLGALRNYGRISRGFVNEKWLVETTAGRYLLKRRHPNLREPVLVGAQHALMRYLHSTGFPVPTVIPARHAATFLTLENETYEIQAYIPGAPCDITKPTHFAAAARTLGWYHNAVRGFDHPVLHRPGARYGPKALGRIVDRLAAAWHGRTSPQVDRLIGELTEHTRDLETCFAEFNRLPELVIHGDYYADNLILRDDVVVGVVDYDLAHWSSRAIELAEALIYFATERPGPLKYIVYAGVLDLAAVREFLAAYVDTTRLSRAETSALPHLIRAIWLCASLDPPLKPLLSLEAAPQALPEVLRLANWACEHASDIVEIGLALAPVHQ
jgi:homoserine kinase type II